MYKELLRKSAKESGNSACMGIDPNLSALPEGLRVDDFFLSLFEEMDKRNLMPSAFKPNIGYFAKLDRPREGKFEGSIALSNFL